MGRYAILSLSGSGTDERPFIDFLATTIRSTRNYSDYPMGAWAADKETGIRNYIYSLVCPLCILYHILIILTFCPRIIPSTHQHIRPSTSLPIGVSMQSVKYGLRFFGLSQTASSASMAMSIPCSHLCLLITELSQRVISISPQSTLLLEKGSPSFLGTVTPSPSSSSCSILRVIIGSADYS